MLLALPWFRAGRSIRGIDAASMECDAPELSRLNHEHPGLMNRCPDGGGRTVQRSGSAMTSSTEVPGRTATILSTDQPRSGEQSSVRRPNYLLYGRYQSYALTN
jgi:hypothetical protein